MTMLRKPIKRALVSVYDKNGLVEFAAALHKAGVEIVSTGSTAATIEKSGVPVVPVETLTGFPESLDGRVKTLHPMIHAGILADVRLQSHVDQLHTLGITPFGEPRRRNFIDGNFGYYLFHGRPRSIDIWQ